MQIVHVVSSIAKINFGIWNAAIFASERLRDEHRIFSVLWVCNEPQDLPQERLPIVFIGKKKPDDERFGKLLSEFHANPENTIMVTHGCWGTQTEIGARLRSMGFVWIYTPHGMLEPWSMQQKKWKKKIYFSLFEKPLSIKASAIRAVGEVEQHNLTKIYTNEIWEIGNGVKLPGLPVKPSGRMNFLFMSRLHYKKGIVQLVTAWNKTMQDANAHLIVAGPDEGELEKIKPFFGGNIEYAGAVYGEEKTHLLKPAHYFVLPSYSEGFPTSVVEAMSFGAIPVISAGCNFPQIFAEHLGFQAEPDVDSLGSVLAQLKSLPFDGELSQRNHKYIRENLSEQRIAEKLMRMYTRLLGSVNI